jgi:hypothetical protein
MFGFAVLGCWANAGVRASGERLVATSAAANKVRSKALDFGLTSSLIRHSPFSVFIVEPSSVDRIQLRRPPAIALLARPMSP